MAGSLLVSALLLAACTGSGSGIDATTTSAGDAGTTADPWKAEDPPSEWASGLTIGYIPPGFAFVWNEGHETATFHRFTVRR
jgi:hypothetical protein